MELVKRNLHQMCRKSEAVSQVTFDEDFNVPDAKPDVGRMIQKKGEVEISDVQVSEGKARVFGSLVFHLLYVTDDGSRRIHSLKGELPIDETINLDGLLGGDKICLKWDLEDLTIHRINSRKLNIRSVVTFDTSIEELRDTPVPVGLRDGEGISMKKKELRVLELGVQKKDTLRIKETVTLASNKPNIHEILWKDMEVRGLELRPEENKINAKGELFLFCLYAGDDGEQPLQWVEQAIPFHGEVECSGCTAEMIPNIEASMIQANIEVQPDADGEERTFQADAVLELDMKLYQAIEKLAPEIIAEKRHIYKGVSPNVDFYSGFVYDMLGIPQELYTPLFAVARIVGWSAHRIEELIDMDKIIRPAYMSVMEEKE